MARMKIFIGLILALCLQSCTTVDLRSAQLQTSEYDESRENKGRRILENATWRQDMLSRWERFDTWKIVARDIWKSSLVRKLTPVEQPEQSFEFTFRIDKRDAQMKYLNGGKKGEVLGIQSKQSYVIENDKRVPQDNRQVELYLDPVRDYFFWPQQLVNSEIVLYEGEGVIEDQAYHKIFVTNGSVQVSDHEDQYMLWINKSSMHIEYIEFTLRDLLKSYRGVVHYKDYQRVEGIALPHHIVLKDKIRTAKFSHELRVDRMELHKDDSNLSFIIKIKPFEGNVL